MPGTKYALKDNDSIYPLAPLAPETEHRNQIERPEHSVVKGCHGDADLIQDWLTSAQAFELGTPWDQWDAALRNGRVEALQDGTLPCKGANAVKF